MLYSYNRLRIEKVTTNSTANKAKQQEFARQLQRHLASDDMIVYHDESNFNMYLSRTKG